MRSSLVIQETSAPITRINELERERERKIQEEDREIKIRTTANMFI
jgi:hypothetical protein